MLTQLTKFPAPYFGGKRDAAPAVWAALGDVDHYVEVFCGSCAVLLERPHPCNRPYHSETVNDSEGLLCNALRSMQRHPQATAEAASVYVCEADLHARHLALLAWVQAQPLEQLMADPYWCDPEKAGWWLYGLCAWIGSGWCSGQGPWRIDAASGRLVHRPGTREPGVTCQRPHLSNNGMGVHRPGTREPGVLGVSRPTGTASWQACVAADYGATDGFHPMTMPELRRWFHCLSARLRHVRIVNGDWRRVVTTGALKTLAVRQGGGVVGLFLDPPYASTERAFGLYRQDNGAGDNIAAAVRAWCLAHGTDPALRIVLAGYAGEGHEALEAAGWTVHEWFKAGHLKGGMALQGPDGHQQTRERLWCSPQTLGHARGTAQLDFFA